MNPREKVRVCIIYPADPMGVIPGGIDSVIRGILRWAPNDLEMSIVGVTTDPENRSPNKWISCSIGGRAFEFFPLIKFEKSGRQAKVPLTLRYIAAIIGARRQITADVLEFHRIEPCLAFISDMRPKTVVMHQNMSVIRNKGSDIRWKYFPGLYFALEKYILPRVQSVFCVREDAVEDYKKRFPGQAHQFHFTPTWFDTEVFRPPSEPERRSAREQVFAEFGFPENSRVFAWVGRMDRQKNPLLLVDAFQRLQQSTPEARLLLVGDGVLREQVEKRIKVHGLQSQIVLCGLKPASIIAGYLQASDVFVLTSAYEGMPICVLEALGSGLPVVATNVGEISRVVQSGVNGELVTVHEPDYVAAGMARCLNAAEQYRGQASYHAVTEFTPEKVLLPIYENYRRLARNSVGWNERQSRSVE
jgi:glycosyltransferase involved in cell wall biosynthesis